MSTDCLGNFTSHTRNCSDSWSYIRPGTGMTIIPWLLITVLLIVHLPVAIIRIVHWESVQVWSLALAALAIAMTSLAYKSTSYDPQQIYVWTSLPVILDVGAMIQLFALLLENHQDAQRVRTYLSKKGWRYGKWLAIKKEFAIRKFPRKSTKDEPKVEVRKLKTQPHGAGEVGADDGEEEIVVREEIIPLAAAKPRDVRAIILLLTLSGIFGITLIAMQFVGFGHAVKALHSSQSFLLQYCSPAFKTARTVFDRECNLYNVTESGFGGADCIQLPGDQQIWLKGTAAGLGVGIVCEIIDAIVIIRLGKEGSKKKRPWLTMILGITTWALFIGLGVFAGGRIPVQFVDGKVGIIDKVDDSICFSIVVPGRLWGQLLSWEEGFLTGLGSIFNPSAP